MSLQVCDFFKVLCRISSLIVIPEASHSWRANTANAWLNDVNVTSPYLSAPDSQFGLCHCSHPVSPVSPNTLCMSHTELHSAECLSCTQSVFLLRKPFSLLPPLTLSLGCVLGGIFSFFLQSHQETPPLLLAASLSCLFCSQCLAHRCLINAGRRP